MEFQNFTGTLRLNDTAHESYLEQTTASGVTFQTLMQMGPTLSDYDAQEVAAAWYHLKHMPGVTDGCKIRVQGIASQGNNQDRPVLHISGNSIEVLDCATE